MNTEFTLKLKALTLAVMINALIMGSAAFLFDGQIHRHQPSMNGFAGNVTADIHNVQVSLFRP